METIEVQAAPRPAARAPVVVARELTRRYGSGETAVDALRGVSVEIEGGALTAGMGPSGSGKATLMHIPAGPDRPTAGGGAVARTSIGGLHDNPVTKVRRGHHRFIFHFF